MANVEGNPMTEVLYAVRRQDGDLLGDYSFVMVGAPTDWAPAEDDADCAEDAGVYEMVKMTVEVIGTRTLPLCKECDQPAKFWGLCEPHAREDDPESFTEAEPPLPWLPKCTRCGRHHLQECG